MARVFLCSEFPCNNPRLDGSLYERPDDVTVVDNTVLAPVAAPEPEPEPVIVAPPALEVAPLGLPEPAAVADSPEAFDGLITRLAALAQAHGDEALAVALDALFHERGGAVAPDTRERLAARGLADHAGLLGSWKTEADAWRRVLAGEEVDFALCGTFALDEWAAGFLAKALTGAPSANHLRRELRERGVAAFGLT